MKKTLILLLILVLFLLIYIITTNNQLIGTWYYSDSNIDNLDSCNYPSISFTRNKKVKINNKSITDSYKWSYNAESGGFDIIYGDTVIASIDTFLLSNDRLAMIITQNESGKEYTYIKKYFIK